MDEAAKNRETVDRLIAENQQLHRTLEIVHRELYAYKDLGKLSLVGAIQYLIRHKKKLDEVRELLAKVHRSPKQVDQIWAQIDKLVAQTD